MKILVTGGIGFIGSHTCVELLNKGYEVVVIDNFNNSKPEVINKINKITNKKIKFYEGDVCSKELLDQIFKENKIDAVIHFAGYKAVGESVKKPLEYYKNNIYSTINLCEIMIKYDCKRLVFSSSATVYGSPDTLPIKEDFNLSTTNPYANTKLYIEGILKDLYISDNSWSIAILRYFNPIGAHESGLIGEDPLGVPNNIMPFINKVAAKEIDTLGIFGDDYDTKDGTGVRDYIHVVDLAKGHLKAIEYINNNEGIDYYNLGTGVGLSVYDLINTYQKVNNVKIKYKVEKRRPGDIASCYANADYAFEKLGWKATKDIETMCRDSYNFYINNK